MNVCGGGRGGVCVCVCACAHTCVCLCVVVIELLLCFVLKVGLYVMKGKVIYKWGGGGGIM